MVEAVVEDVAQEKGSVLLLEEPFAPMWGGKLISMRLVIAECHGRADT